jgi:hypothetical protein
MMAVQPDKPALRLLSRPAACMTASWCICMARGIVPPRVMVEVLVPQARATCHGPHTSQSRGELVRGGDLSCEAETRRARQRLVARGGDLSCEAETCCARRRLVVGDPSCGELVGDAANWSETCRLASVGLDRGLHSSSSWILSLTLSILAFTLSIVSDFLVIREIFLRSKGGPNPGPRQVR